MKILWNRKIQGVLVENWADTENRKFGCHFALVDGDHYFDKEIEEAETIKLGQLESECASYVYKCLTELLRSIKKGY